MAFGDDYDTPSTDNSNMQQFIETESQKAQLLQQISQLTNTCWDRCMTTPSNKLDSRTSNCIVNCVDRFIDLNLVIAQRFQEENEITNYTFEGVENQEKPLNPNEEFIQLTSKIDFKKLNGNSLDYTAHDFPCMDEESESVETLQLNINEHLKKHITATLNETNALIDILQVTKDNRYMQLKKFGKENHEDNVNSYIAGKKMGLLGSATTLLTGTVRLSKTLSSIKDQNQQNSFYSDLAFLRKEWRIKWFQKHLIGDLGLSSCGSTFQENGGFQILEELEDSSEICEKKHESDLQNLKIILMNNQEGEPILRMNYNDGRKPNHEFHSFHELPPAKDCKLQVDKLNRAQNLLYLQEIFNTMCWESRTLQCPVVVKENRLVINFKGKANLEIDFLILPEKHWFGYQDDTAATVELRAINERTIKEYNLLSDAMITLLRDLLREKHRSSSCAHFSLANPIAGPVQVPMGQRYRGTQFYRAVDHSAADQCHLVFLLPTLIDAIMFHQARKSVLVVLDSVASKCGSGLALEHHVQAAQGVRHCSISLVMRATSYGSLVHWCTLSLAVTRGTTRLSLVSDRIRHEFVYHYHHDNDNGITDYVGDNDNVLAGFLHGQIWNFKIDVLVKLATVKHTWQLVDLRLTNCRKTMDGDVHVGLTVLSKNGQWLLNFASQPNLPKYQLTVTYSKVENHCHSEWKSIDLLQLQRKLMKCDLETIDVLFTALC